MKTKLHYLFNLFLVLASQAYAETCYQQSPNLAKGDDTYYNVENTIQFPIADQITLTKLFNEILGQWQGHISTEECYGPDNAHYTKSKFGRIKTHHLFSGSNGITLNNEVSFDEKMTTINSNVLSPANLFDLKVLDSSHLTIAQKMRRGAATGASRLIEIVYDFHQHSANNLTIKQSIYTNGVYTYSETWSLYR